MNSAGPSVITQEAEPTISHLVRASNPDDVNWFLVRQSLDDLVNGFLRPGSLPTTLRSIIQNYQATSLESLYSAHARPLDAACHHGLSRAVDDILLDQDLGPRMTPMPEPSISYAGTKYAIPNLNGSPNMRMKANMEATMSLYVAALNGHAHIVQKLLEKNADPNDIQIYDLSYPQTALWIASLRGHADVVRVLLSSSKTDVNLVCEASPLFVACQNGHMRVVELLLRSGAKVDHERERERTDHATPIVIASHNGHKDIVDMLLNSNANPFQQTRNGFNAMRCAAVNGHTAVVKSLYTAYVNRVGAHKAVEHLQGGPGLPALHLACIRGHFDVVRFLVMTAKVNIYQMDVMQKTPAQIARTNGHYTIADWLDKRNEHISLRGLELTIPKSQSASNGPTKVFGFAEIKWISAPDLHTAIRLADDDTSRVAKRCVPRRRSQLEIRDINAALANELARVRKLEEDKEAMIQSKMELVQKTADEMQRLRDEIERLRDVNAKQKKTIERTLQQDLNREL